MANKKILVLSWEFPPRIVGGIARHVAELYPEIVLLGYEIHIVTVAVNNSPRLEKIEGIQVHRVIVDEAHDFFAWISNMNQSMLRYAQQLISENGNFELIHAHDWLVADSAVPLKHLFKIPLVATIHATEHGRHNGIHNPTQSYISAQEGKLIYEAWRVIVCSDYMKREVNQTLGCPLDKIDIVYNGIRPEKKLQDPNFDYWQFRRRFAQDEEKIIYYVGRITYEKGIQVLVKAMPKILHATEMKTKCVIIGGGNTEHWQNLAQSLGIRHHCNFTGFMSEEDLNRFTTIADCAVFPSLYEPFGIVVLESFASCVPVVVSDTGGLPEVVIHEKTGIVTRANDPDSLAWGILELLNNPEYAQMLVKNAYGDLYRRFQWNNLAQQTVDVYELVLEQRKKVVW